MRKHLSAASALLAATALFSVLGSSPAQAATTRATTSTAQTAADRALLYLTRQQENDGSIAENDGATEDTVLGTAAAGHDPNAIVSCTGATPLDYLKTVADQKLSSLGAGALGKLILAAVAARQDPRAFGQAAPHDLVAQLQSLQAASGAYGSGETFDQSLAMLALRAAGASIPASAVSYLKSAQDSDGGWNYLGVKDNAAGSDTNSTAVALEALAAAGDGSATAAALSWLHSQQQADGGFPYQGSGSDPDSDSLVIEGLVAAGQDPRSAAWSKGSANALGNLVGFQDQPTGGYTFPGNPNPDAFTTSQVPEGLMLVALPLTPLYAAGSGVPGAGCLSSPGAYTPLSAPYRAYDSRLAGGAFGSGETRTLQLAGQGGVPASGVRAVVLNLTVTGTDASGYLTVFPAGVPFRPSASNLNWAPGETKSNQVTVPGSGDISIFNHFGAADVIVDVEGYFAAPATAGGRYQALSPRRLLDTRGGAGAFGPGETRQLQVPTSAVPAGASAVVLNVTATDTSSAGYLTVYPGPGSPPGSSNLNWAAGETVPARVTVALAAGGTVSLYNFAGSADVVVDLNGYYTGSSQAGGSLFTPLPPVRVLDTRTSGTPAGPAAVEVILAGRNGIPTGAAAAVLNVTVTDTTSASYLRVYPPGNAPATSDLNWLAGQTVANADVAGLGPDGGLDYLNFAGTADVILDVVGYYS